MVALTGDFHVFTSGFSTRVSAVLLSISYITKTWYVRAFFGVLSRHYQFRPFQLYLPSPMGTPPEL
jgi:hypothetical protein